MSVQPEEAVGRYVVTGRVQGVGYRLWCRHQAEALGVHGSVRNRCDGKVEVLARAAPDVLRAFEAKLRQGPLPARVEGVASLPVHDEPSSAGFEIVS
ncbi:MAG TPA: acylphosphatase [Longimicrobiales bacterium]|nr:acylphosphatase [Longimicrobiales bacterium]